jgi:glycosyltransferase involved in cell wall biosynthesis
MGSMRIVRVVAVLEPGGAQLAIARLTRELRRRGLQTRILAASATREGVDLLAREGLEVEVRREHRALHGPSASPASQYACNPALAEWLAPRLAEADLVHAHMFGAWWAASRAVLDGVPLVASEHNAVRWPARPRTDEMRTALRRVDRFYTHGPATRAMLAEAGYPSVRVRVGISPIEAGQSRRLAGVPVPRIVFAGRLHGEKGPDLLIDAVSRMRKPVPTMILGAGPAGDSLRRRVARLALEDLVSFRGWQPRVAPFLLGASACVVPSRHESWSQTAVLAMRLGVPVVATAVEGLPWTLADARGVLVAPDDPAALARAIDDVVEKRIRPDLHGARRYAAAFTPARVAAAYAADYAALASARRSDRPRRVRLTVPAPAAGLAAAG